MRSLIFAFVLFFGSPAFAQIEPPLQGNWTITGFIQLYNVENAPIGTINVPIAFTMPAPVRDGSVYRSRTTLIPGGGAGSYIEMMYRLDQPGTVRVFIVYTEPGIVYHAEGKFLGDIARLTARSPLNGDLSIHLVTEGMARNRGIGTTMVLTRR